MNNVLVLGAGGMAGHIVALYLREHGYTVDSLSATTPLDEKTQLIDVQNHAALISAIESKQYDAVINCIGLLVKESEERKDLAVYLNSYLPHFLEHHFKDRKTRLVHLSTDCVFSGKKPPYREDSEKDGELFYDRSKALGEVINDKDLTLRQSIIGPDMKPKGTGLFNWFAQQHGEIFGYTKSIWNGVTTIELAKGIDAALKQNLTGLYHFVPSSSISKYDLLQLLRKIFDREELTISPTDGIAYNKTLSNNRTDFDYIVPTYEEMVQEMKQWIDSHKDLYQHYYNG
jgi:dTDP-4-dehydrorhamnose reductase